MKQRTVTLDCSAELARAIALATRLYAHAAYPAGGSECAQTAREALLDIARLFESHPGGELILRRRMVPQLRAAVRWCLSEDAHPDVEWPPGLESILADHSKSA